MTMYPTFLNTYSSPFGNPFGLPYGGAVIPPVIEKLLIWAKGATILGSAIPYGIIDEDYSAPETYGIYRRDSYNIVGRFPLRIEANGDTITEEWDGHINATYNIHPQHTVALTADAVEGPFLNGPRTQLELTAYVEGKGSVFFNPAIGYLLYNDVLTGQELWDVQIFMGILCPLYDEVTGEELIDGVSDTAVLGNCPETLIMLPGMAMTSDLEMI